MTTNRGLQMVTGPFGYTGRYLVRALNAAGLPVAGLTDRRQPAGLAASALRIFPYDFDRPDALTSHLAGVEVLYNTYWVRFDRGATTFDLAVRRTEALLTAARQAGVRRVVHLSVTHASPDSPLPYFRGKGIAERLVRDSGLSYAILRPALVFGAGDILLNNIAWFLRRSPVFGVPGDGRYRVQPVAADDLAAAVVAAGAGQDDTEADVVGPDNLTFMELVTRIRDAVGGSRWIVPAPAGLVLLATRIAGHAMGDVVLTPHEIAGLRANLLTSDTSSAGWRTFGDWLRTAGPRLGLHYESELARHYR